MPVFLFITAALQLTDNQVLALVAPRLNAAFWPGSAIDASWLLTAYPIGAAIGPLSLTRFAPSFHGRRAVVAALAVLAATQLAFALQPTIEIAFALRALAGAASGVLSYSLLIEAVNCGDRAVTAMTSGFLLAYVLAIPSAAKVAAGLGLPALFQGLGGLSLLLCAAACFVVPSTRRHLTATRPKPFRHFLRNPTYRAGLLTSVLVGAALAGPVAIFPKMLQTQAGLGLSDVAVIYYIGGIGPVLALPFVPRIIRSLGRKRTSVAGALLLVGPLLAMPLGAHGIFAAAVLLMLALSFETLRRSALQGHIGTLAPQEDRPRYLSLRNMAVQVSVSGGVSLAIVLDDAGGFVVACAVAAALAAASALFIPAQRGADHPGDTSCPGN